MSASRDTIESEKYEDIYTLKENSVAYKYCLGALEKEDNKVLRKGSLCKIVFVHCIDENLLTVNEVHLETLFRSTDIWVVNKYDLVHISPALVRAFSAISKPSARVEIATNKFLCNALSTIKVGSQVYLCPDADISEQDANQWELAVVRYVGPLPELGTASHFYGLVLDRTSTQGDGDGSYCNRHYFTCPTGCRGTFVSINRLRPCPTGVPSTDASHRQNSNTLMQANRNNNESAKTNFRTTLVLQLKDQKNIPKTESLRVDETKPMSRKPFGSTERSDKLIDVDSIDECPLRVGDRVVWMSDDSVAEPGTVRWMGVLSEHRIPQQRVGVEFDKPVGTGSGIYKGIEYFQSKLRHSSFLPIDSLLRAEDFYGKPEDNAPKKVKGVNSNAKSSTSSLFSSHLATKSDTATKTRHPELPSWTHTRAVVQLPDYQDKHSSSRDVQTFDVNKPSCRSDYVFPETFTNINITKSKLDNANKRPSKDTKKSETGLDSYPIGEASLKNYSLSSSATDNQKRRTVGDIPVTRTKSTEVKIRHSYARDGNAHHSNDVTDFLDIYSSASPETNQRQGTKDKLRTISTPQLNNNDSSGFEVIGLGILSNSGSNVRKANEWRETVQLSPNVSDCSDDLYEPLSEPLDLGVGSVVEVLVKNQPQYGVIRWIGTVPEDLKARQVAGIEMEEEMLGCSDGTFNARRYFQCNPKKALFIGLNQCKKDGRFQESIINHADNKTKLFGPEDCPVIPGAVRPFTVSRQEDMDVVCGKYKGIQGHHNSCYLDATLFSMFAFSSAFDSLLFRPCGPNDTAKYEEVQRVLREEIVNPLRKNQFCRWDRVMKLRTLLENHSSVTGLTSEEKDPEEFLTSLVAQMLKAKPFLKLSSGQDAYHYQLFIEKDEQLRSPTVQQLFEQSFLSSDIKLKEVPSCLIIQMPRFGKSYKMYPRIFPSPLLDVTDIIEDSPRQCTVCGKLAEFECRECFGKNGIESNTLESISFCKSCRDTVHSHKLRSAHKFRKLTVPVEFSILQDHCAIPRLYMHLFAVVCIETSHYVSFVKCGSLPDSPWCFFDSMADRKGEQNGYNIPEVVPCPDVPYWLSEEGVRDLSEFNDDRKLPEHAKRLLCDAYMCMYQSSDMIMYK